MVRFALWDFVHRTQSSGLHLSFRPAEIIRSPFQVRERMGWDVGCSHSCPSSGVITCSSDQRSSNRTGYSLAASPPYPHRRVHWPRWLSKLTADNLPPSCLLPYGHVSRPPFYLSLTLSLSLYLSINIDIVIRAMSFTVLYNLVHQLLDCDSSATGYLLQKRQFTQQLWPSKRHPVTSRSSHLSVTERIAMLTVLFSSFKSST